MGWQAFCKCQRKQGRAIFRALASRSAWREAFMSDHKVISPRRDPRSVAEMLLKTRGAEQALKRVASEKASARRARSRQRFQFWLAISEVIAEHEQPGSKQG